MLTASMLCVATASGANESISGATIGYTCMGCHGVNGKSPGSIPSIAGQSEAMLAAKLLAYRDGAQKGTIMNRIAKGYTDAELQAVAAFFAAIPAQ
jgi:sulfide dehydrogenase cytochrome subunit